MQRRQLARIAATSFGSGGLPPHVSILNSRFTLVDGAGNQRSVQTQYLDVVILDFNEKMARIFWEPPVNGMLNFNPDEGRPPQCFSDNGVGPSSRAIEPQAKTCKPDSTHTFGCRWSVFGSAISKRDGKTKIPACQNGVKTMLLIATVQQGPNGAISSLEVAEMPFMLRIPPASITNFAKYGKEIAGYGEVELPWTGQKENLELPLVITRISFAEGEVGKLNFKPVGYINAEVDAIIEKIDDRLADTLVGRDDVPWDGAMIETKPQAQISPAQGTALLKAVESQQVIPPQFGGPPAAASEPKPRGRPKKQAEAQPAPAPFAGPAPALPQDGSIPPFLRRDAGAQEVKNPTVGQKAQPAFGIQNNAPPPGADMNQMLNEAFGLPTNTGDLGAIKPFK